MNGLGVGRCEGSVSWLSLLYKPTNQCTGFITLVAPPCLRQDELDDDDIMILDNGEQVFLWMGPRCSEVEVKLAYKSAQVSTGQVSTACDPAARRSGSHSFIRTHKSQSIS